MEIFKLFGSIFVENDAANESLDKTDEKAKGVGATFLEGVGTAAKWGAAIIGAAAGVVGAVISATNETAAYADEIDKLSERTGINREELQRLKYAFEQSGADVGKLENGFKTLSAQMESAKDGTAKSVEGFEALGISVDDLKNKSQEEIFAQVIAGLADMEQGSERNALGNSLLGKSYTDMIPLLNAGSEGINELKDRADELGIVMSEDAVKANVVYGDTMADVQKSIAGMTHELTNAALPIIQDVLDLILENMPVVKDLIDKFAPILTDLLATIVPILFDMVEQLLPVIFDLLEALMPIFADIVKIILPPLLELLKTLLPPLIKIVEALLPPIIDLLNLVLPIITSLIDLIAPLIDIIFELIAPLFDLLDLILPPLIAVIKIVAEVLTNNLKGAFESIGKIVDDVKTIFSNLIDFIKSVFTGDWKGAWENVKNIFGAVFDGMKELFKIPINWIIDGINGFIGAINKIEIPEWVPLVGGKGFNISTIPRLAKGLDYVPYDEYPAILHKGERVMPADENKEYTGGGKGNIINNFNISQLVVREEADIKKISRELYNLEVREKRSKGYVH